MKIATLVYIRATTVISCVLASLKIPDAHFEKLSYKRLIKATETTNELQNRDSTREQAIGRVIGNERIGLIVLSQCLGA